MGWKGTVRSIGAAVRAAERESKRRNRELEKQEKALAKMQELERAAFEVEVYENHIDVIQSLHKECSPRIDWVKVANSPKPVKPSCSSERASLARSKLENYTPSFFDKLFRKEEKTRQKLEKDLSLAQQADQKSEEEKFKEWEAEVADWEESSSLSNLLLSGDQSSKIKVIDELNPFAEISDLGSSLSFSVGADSIMEAEINIHSSEIVPNETKSLLASGRLSIKKMPKGRFNEIFQDYVCSCVLRIANEMFSILPDDIVVVTASDELLNKKTGHLETLPILSVAVSRTTLEKLNMEHIDPSDSMGNFLHNMAFKKTQGFAPIDRVDISQLGK